MRLITHQDLASTLTFDFETPYNHSKPWLREAFPVSLGVYVNGEYFKWIINHQDIAPTFDREAVKQIFDSADEIIAHNICFDLHWLRSCGIILKPDIRLYDTMIAEYLIQGQSKTYGELSLEQLSNDYLKNSKTR